MADEDQIRESFSTWLEANTPVGTRLDIRHTSYLVLEVCCGGEDPDFGYICCRKLGHEGRCYCQHKSVEFDPPGGYTSGASKPLPVFLTL